MNTIQDKIKLNFDDSFLKEEVRCDFRVSEKQKEIWAIELDLLNEFDRVCKKYDFKYFVWAGTMLGTVRHQGFIPWDDDLDVCMTRDQYEKFVNVAESEFSEPYFLQTAISDRKFFLEYARLRNSETTGIVNWNKSLDYNNGIFLDIYIMDEYPEDNKIELFLKKREFWHRLCSYYYLDCTNRHGVKKLLPLFIQNTVFRFISYENIVKQYEKELKKQHNSVKKVGLITHIKKFMLKNWCYKEDISAVVYMPFENLTVPVPINYDSILKNMYGDYMIFPPVSERGSWHNNIITFDARIPYKEYLKQLNENEKNKK